MINQVCFISLQFEKLTDLSCGSVCSPALQQCCIYCPKGTDSPFKIIILGNQDRSEMAVSVHSLQHGKAEDDFCAVLALAGMELIIPTAALPGLCCVLVAGKVLINHTLVFGLLLPSTPQHQAASPASCPH